MVADIDENGDIAYATAATKIGGGCEAEAVRLVKAYPEYKPALQRGQPVYRKAYFPVRFSIEFE